MNFAAELNSHDLKATTQRLEIVEILYANGHLNIDEMYKLLKSKFPTLSLATIYKNIHLMRDRFFLTEVKIPNAKNVYELTKKEHSHIVCSKCKCVIDINLDTSDIVSQAKSISEYTLDTSSIVLNGLCPKCLKG